MNIPFTITTEHILIVALFLGVAALGWMVVQLNAKLKKFLVGSNVENLEDSISSIETNIRELQNFKDGMTSYLTSVEKRLQKSTQAIYTVRFNPFKGTTGSGGNQSFATAFLNEGGSGVVISTLYAREHVSMFSKPIVKGSSEYELSTEEKEAVDGALKMLTENTNVAK